MPVEFLGSGNNTKRITTSGAWKIYGQGGNDSISISSTVRDSFTDMLFGGGRQNDRLYGVFGKDLLDGGHGNDILDTLIGGAGGDTLVGGSTALANAGGSTRRITPLRAPPFAC